MYTVMLLNNSPSEVNEANMKKVLDAAGFKSDEAKIKSVIAALDGVDVEKVISEAQSSFAAAPAAASGAAPAAAPAAAKEEKAKAPEVDASAGLGNLF